jgi:predicted RNA methylase
MKNEEEYKKEVDAIIYELCDTLLRDKDTNKNITCIINELDNDIIIKKNIVKTIETKKERKQKAIKEYVTKPEDNNSNALNLYNIRQEAHADLIEYNTRNAVCNV